MDAFMKQMGMPAGMTQFSMSMANSKGSMSEPNSGVKTKKPTPNKPFIIKVQANQSGPCMVYDDGKKFEVSIPEENCKELGKLRHVVSRGAHCPGGLPNKEYLDAFVTTSNTLMYLRKNTLF